MNTDKTHLSNEEISQHIREHLLKVISLKSFSNHEISNYINKYFESRLFLNEFIQVSSSPYTIVGQAPKGILRNQLPAAALLWYWNNRLCPMYTLTLWWASQKHSKPVSMRCYVPALSKECTLLKSFGVQIFLIREKRYLTSYILNAQNLDSEFWKLLEQEDHKENIGDIHAAKIYIDSNIEKPKAPNQILRAEWAKRLEQEIGIAFRFYNDPKNTGKIEMELPIVQNSHYRDFFTKNDILLSGLYKYMYEAFENPDTDLLEFINTPEEILKGAPIHNSFVKQLMKCAWFASSRTKFGLSFISIELDGSLKEVVIDIKALGKKVDNFWDRMPFTFPFYYFQLMGNGACPVDPMQFYKNLPLYQGDISEGWNFVNDLLAEATSLKRWTIPFGAYVQLDMDEIKAIRVFELGQDVACLLLNNSDEYYLLWVNPLNKNLVFSNSIELGFIAGQISIENVLENNQISKDKLEALSENNTNQDNIEKLKLAMAIPLAAIIRDFWVVEERVKVFGAARITGKAPQLPTKQKQKPIVYLPRIRYVGDIKTLAEPLHLKTRRPHFVTGHLRRAAEASEKQIFLARKYGIVVPAGFTFVKPHRRGDKAQETIYRSRSALQCIRALRPSDATGKKDTWFTFELNVKNWLQKNRFEVEHLSGAKNGDGGVDIQANKGDDVLLIQCKYWHTKNIGPAVIRELMGTLQTFPSGSRGVIITSTELTEGAQKLAKNNGIQFLQNVNFNREIDFKLS